jgi:hypothetical protein
VSVCCWIIDRRRLPPPIFRDHFQHCRSLAAESPGICLTSIIEFSSAVFTSTVTVLRDIMEGTFPSQESQRAGHRSHMVSCSVQVLDTEIIRQGCITRGGSRVPDHAGALNAALCRALVAAVRRRARVVGESIGTGPLGSRCCFHAVDSEPVLGCRRAGLRWDRGWVCTACRQRQAKDENPTV